MGWAAVGHRARAGMHMHLNATLARPRPQRATEFGEPLCIGRSNIPAVPALCLVSLRTISVLTSCAYSSVMSAPGRVHSVAGLEVRYVLKLAQTMPACSARHALCMLSTAPLASPNKLAMPALLQVLLWLTRYRPEPQLHRLGEAT